MIRQAPTADTTNLRRARTLAASLCFVLVGSALYAHNVRAESTTLLSTAPHHPSHSHGIPTLASAAHLQAGSTAWTSLRDGGCASNNWDAARRECVAVPGAAATAARLSSVVSR
jgi:hypothetical protein